MKLAKKILRSISWVYFLSLVFCFDAYAQEKKGGPTPTLGSDNYVMGSSFRDFGFVRYGKSSTQKALTPISWVNEQSYITLLDAYLVNSEKNAFIILNNQIGLNLGYGDSIHTEIIFQPNRIGYFNDTLVYITKGPGDTITHILPLKGHSKLENLVWIESKTGKIGGEPLSIPIWAQIENRVDGENYYDFEMKIIFDATVFIPKSFSGSEVKENLINDKGKRHIIIRGKNILASNTKTRIGEIVGILALSSESSTPLNIEVFKTFSHPWIETRAIDGFVAAEEFCQSDLSLIGIAAGFPETIIKPNPAEVVANIEITSGESGNFSASVINLHGKEIDKIEWSQYCPKGNVKTKIIPLNIYEYPNGMYTVIIRTPFYSKTRKFGVIK